MERSNQFDILASFNGVDVVPVSIVVVSGKKHNQTVYNAAGNEKPEYEEIESPFSDVIVERYEVVKTKGHVEHCRNYLRCKFLCVGVVNGY